jgi:outer membrane receptor protein involved in Fe transport
MQTNFFVHKRAFFLLLFALTHLVSTAQNAIVRGKITDKSTKEALVGVNVILADGTGAASDINGQYKVSVPAGEVKISFRFVGYKEINMTLQLKAGEEKVLDITLEEVNTELETVVVSAGRFEQKLEDVTVSMNVIKPSLIENKNTLNCETIIDQVPGVSVQDGQASIRGGSGFAYGAGSRVLLMVDDLPLLAADAGDVKWNTLPIENVEQIEVIKGASSVLFGSSALNGVINIRTAYPTDKPVTKIALTSGIYDNPARDTARWWDKNPMYHGINFFHSRKIDRFDLVVGGAAFSDKGYRMGEEEYRGRINFNTRYRSRIEGLSFGVNGNYQYSKAGIFIIWKNSNEIYVPYGYDPALGWNPESNPASTISVNLGTRMNIDPYITYFAKNGDRHALRTRVYWTRNVNNTNQSADAYMTYGEYQYSKKFKNDLNITAGAVGYYSKIMSELYGDHYGKNMGAFLQADKKINRLTLSAGMRGEYFRIDTAETASRTSLGNLNINLPFKPVFRAGANYRVREETYLRASVGQGYRFPTVAEKYVSTAVGALNIFPNPALAAESGWSAEIGIKQGVKIGKWLGYADAAFFVTQYSNMMEFAFGVYNPDSIPLNLNPNHPGYLTNWVGFRAQNAEDARISGVDLSLIGKGKIFKKIDMTVFAGYTYMRPITLNNDSEYLYSFSDGKTIRTIDGKEAMMLKYRFQHMAKADVQFDYKKFGFGFSVRYNSNVHNIDRTFENLEVRLGAGVLPLYDYILPGLPAYRKEHNRGACVADARLAYTVAKGTRIAAVVNNVFNLEYMGRPGDVQAPRTFALQAVVTF